MTKEDIKQAIIELQEASKPILEQLNIAKKEFDEKASKLNLIFTTKLDLYYDENLKDKNGNSIQIGHRIKKDNSELTVVNRGMQFIFGEPIFNPRIMAKKDNKKKEIELSPSDLIKFEIL